MPGEEDRGRGEADSLGFKRGRAAVSVNMHRALEMGWSPSKQMLWLKVVTGWKVANGAPGICSADCGYALTTERTKQPEYLYVSVEVARNTHSKLVTFECIIFCYLWIFNRFNMFNRPPKSGSLSEDFCHGNTKSISGLLKELGSWETKGAVFEVVGML